MIQQNMIDVVTTNDCPKVTPADLLEEKATPDDLRKLERAMGVFTSTTAFLGALKQVLTDLEGFPEAKALEDFIPIMAQVESDAMNGPDEQPSPVNCSDGVGGDGVQE